MADKSEEVHQSPGRVAQLLMHCPLHQKVVGSIPSQGTNGRQPIDVSLSLSLFLSQINYISSGEEKINK